MKFSKGIHAIDSHTMGEPTRIVVGGIPQINGETMADKKKYLEDNLDYVRTALMHEPRGHNDMFGSIITSSNNKEADFFIKTNHQDMTIELYKKQLFSILPENKQLTALTKYTPDGREAAHEPAIYRSLTGDLYLSPSQKQAPEKQLLRHLLLPAAAEGILGGVMLAMGRALMSRPRLLLLDEPSMGLAPLLVKEIFNIIKEINESGTTVLLVEQNANLALTYAHRGYILKNGYVDLEGTSSELSNNEDVKKAQVGFF